MKQNNNKQTKFDFVFVNPDFEFLARALEKQNKGLSGLLIFENELSRNDSYTTTFTFPIHFYDVFRKKKSLSVYQNAFINFAHLFQSQKVLYFESTRFSKIKTYFTDYVFKNTYRKKSQVVSIQNISEFKFLKNNLRNGIYFQEYKFNTSRFFIEILKHFKKQGGQIITNTSFQFEKEKLIFKPSKAQITASKIQFCSPQQKNIYQFPIESFPGFSMLVTYKKEIYSFSEHKNNLLFEVLKPSNKNFGEKHAQKIIQSYFNAKISKTAIIKTDKNIDSATLNRILKNTSKPFECSLKIEALEDVHEICHEKFDVAKQTGIVYEDFKILFHRYGKEMDELTEIAYDIMNKFREPDEIWKQAENIYQQKKEWKK